MTAPDRRSGLVLDTRELGRRAGATKVVRTSVQAPADLGTEVVGVPVDSPVVLDLRLESVVEGVLVSGTAVVELAGECGRCLTPLADELEVDLQELFVYPDSEATEEEASRLSDDLLDLEPVLRDAVVLELPFQPLCRSDCAGLCAECGTNLNLEQGHRHAADQDPRWAALRRFEAEDRQTYDVASN